MSKISISFDPAADTQTSVAELIARIYGPVAHTATTLVAQEPEEPAGTPAAAGQLSASGLPWDVRIHSTPAALTDKGVWRKKRGVSDELVDSVEAELRGQPAATAPVQPAMPALTPPAVAVAAPVVPGAYESFVDYLAANTHSAANPTGRVTQEWMSAMLVYCGIASGQLQDLQAKSPAEILAVRAEFEKQLSA